VTEREVEIRKSVTATETVVICDYCGLEIEDDHARDRLVNSPRVVVRDRAGNTYVEASRDEDQIYTTNRQAPHLKFGETYDLHADCRVEAFGGGSTDE